MPSKVKVRALEVCGGVGGTRQLVFVAMMLVGVAARWWRCRQNALGDGGNFGAFDTGVNNQNDFQLNQKQRNTTPFDN